jgi:hypothetical protein
MKASKEFIESLELLTYDSQRFPRGDKETVAIQVETLRSLISILRFQHKTPYVDKEKDAKLNQFEKAIRGQSITP